MIVTRRRVDLQEAVSLGLLALVMLAGVGLIAVPLVRATHDAYESVATDRARLAVLRAKRADLKALEAELKAQRSHADNRPTFLEATSSVVAWERFETLLKAIVSARGGVLMGSRGLPLDTEAGLQAVRMEITVRAPREHIQTVVHGIETTTPVIFFERIKLTAAQQSGAPEQDAIDMTATLRLLTVIAAPKAARR